MFNRGKVSVSPSIPRKLRNIIKGRLQVPIAVKTPSGSNQEWDDMEECSEEGSNQEWDDMEECSEEGSNQEWEDMEECSEEVSHFTSEDDYSPVEQLRCCAGLSSLDSITDRLVIPSCKSLLELDSDDFDYFKNAIPVAASTKIFSEATLSEDETSHFKHVKHVKESTFLLPEPPVFEDITDDVDCFKLGNPLASSTRIFPVVSFAEEEIAHFQDVKHVKESTFLLPEPPVFEDITDDVDCFKLRNPLTSSKLIFPEVSFAEEEIDMMSQMKSLTRCPSIDVSSISRVSLPFETSFDSSIQSTSQKNKNYPEDRENNCSTDATILALYNSLNVSTTPKAPSKSEDDSIAEFSAPSKECGTSNVGSQSSRIICGSVIAENLQEEIGSRTNSFYNSFKRSRTKLSNIQRRGKYSNSILDYTNFRSLQDISNHDLKQPSRTFTLTRNDSVTETEVQENLLSANKKKYKNSKVLGTEKRKNVLSASKKKDKKSKALLENQTFLTDVPVCILSNKKDVLRPLKVMKPIYRSDVPIDDLCSKEMKLGNCNQNLEISRKHQIFYYK